MDHTTNTVSIDKNEHKKHNQILENKGEKTTNTEKGQKVKGKVHALKLPKFSHGQANKGDSFLLGILQIFLLPIFIFSCSIFFCMPIQQ